MARPALDTMGKSPPRRAVRSFARVPALNLLSISLSLLCAGCDLPGRPDPADRPVPADQVFDFALLYGQNCAGCHGADGKLGPAPPLNDPLFRQIVPEAELESVITNGRNKTLMPAFAREKGGALTKAQIQILVHEIKGQPYRVIARQESASAVEVVSDAGGTSPKWGSPGKPPAGVPAYTCQSTNDGNVSSAPHEVS